ncbi:hypothetical protein [Cohnella soli]|uniref:SMI1/KNR4 family protein n=1 Tax=Cohnella soli TaxID=425005 RepID=A0ABW0HP47_9BACL
MNNRNFPIYSFVLNSKGLIHQLKAELDLGRLAEVANDAVREFLNKYGENDPWDKAPNHFDGFAQIYRDIPGVQGTTDIWTYHFDGETSLDEMESDLAEMMLQEGSRICEWFLAVNDGHFIKPVNYDFRNGYINALLRYIWDEFDDPVLPSVLACKSHHVFTLTNEGGGYAIVPGLCAINRVGYIVLDQACDIGVGFRLEPSVALQEKRRLVSCLERMNSWL